MKFKTQREKIRTVAGRWKSLHCRDGEWSKSPVISLAPGRFPSHRDKKEIWLKLAELNPETTTAEQVNEIIGNDSWTNLRCDECKKLTTVLLMVGEEPDYESRTARLCRNCIAKAAQMEWPNE